MVVGLTGGIGSGKSTVLKEFESLGIPVYIADVEAKIIMNTSLEVQSKIIALLGKQAYHNHQLNRAYIANKVFNNKDLLTQLNAIVHPAVHQHFKKFVALQTAHYLVYENAILFENKSEELCNKVIVVTASKENRISRVMLRDHIDREAVLARMKNQWSQEDKIAKADFIIKNDDVLLLKEQILKIHEQLMEINL
ncbi:dephospho-CoA kinase [Wenyingzhuangia heitensis]|uniref:Dephospho-CoA kinase n=1 Tax=Wenyingzhuangia heitensis TaxID=1487859 RepID=A0ABX0UE35_9FLAO|nr:dephospho-CoA kinase [Wenyingzhuangia heitensis]NIJ46145.1 dephospho-CoA kinase [Wenyingzhuangia heitensis]